MNDQLVAISGALAGVIVGLLGQHALAMAGDRRRAQYETTARLYADRRATYVRFIALLGTIGRELREWTDDSGRLLPEFDGQTAATHFSEHGRNIRDLAWELKLVGSDATGQHAMEVMGLIAKDCEDIAATSAYPRGKRVDPFGKRIPDAAFFEEEQGFLWAARADLGASDPRTGYNYWVSRDFGTYERKYRKRRIAKT